MLSSVGIVVVVLGILGILYGIVQKVKAGRIVDAPLVTTGDAARSGQSLAGPKGQISAQGGVVCATPVVAPFSGQHCLYYKITCKAEWKEGQVNESKVIDERVEAATFAIDDGTGPIWIDAREGGDFEPTHTKRATQGTGVLGGITGTELTFGNYRVQTAMFSMGTKYTVEEEILPFVPRLYACGKVAEQGGAIVSPKWRQLILSAKSRDELLASATKGAKIALAVGAAAFFVGSTMAAVGHLLAPAESASAASRDAKPAPTPTAVALPSPVETSTATAPFPSPPPSGVPTSETHTTSASLVKGKPSPSSSSSSSVPKAKKPDAGAPSRK
jgi:hypothetical protein